ncbi:uncharacterized protein BcabD6B2_07300 [Babesia caballi]|uniref:Membrane protein, putative n=1 Tax=Babesia caballi TaxID=5871 RepID=A0AAV4LNC6_BABCB|nr:membrane protein, putative [Babesia caballi]
MERAVRNFIIIITLDIVVFIASVVIWCRMRNRIVDIIHEGFQGLLQLHRKARGKDAKPQDTSEPIDQVKFKSSFDASSDGTDVEYDSENAFGGDVMGHSTETAAAGSLYIAPRKVTRFTVGIGKAAASKKTNKNSWWYYLLYGKSNRIRNNEAVLYLKFMRGTCIMLLIVSAVTFIANLVILTHLAIHDKPHKLFMYSFDELRSCKVTVWTLYTTTWVYSLIVYVHILKFRKRVNKGKQITILLRPQLHTIMICGFDKTITDPTFFYRYFERYFPEHVLAVHIVHNHSKRMALEEELRAAKAQLCLCRDMSIIVNRDRKEKRRSASMSRPTAAESVDRSIVVSGRRQPTVPEARPRRSRSCGHLYVPGQLGDASARLGGSSLSSGNLLTLPTNTNEEPAKPSEPLQRGITKYITRVFGGSGAALSSQQESYNPEDFGQRFTNLLKRVKELKVLIGQEANRTHTTSSSICFVSFADSNIVLHILKDRRILEDMPTWRISPAPHPRDIVWQHLHMPKWYIAIRMIAVNITLIALYSVITWILSHLNLLRTVKKQEMIEGTLGNTFKISDLTERSFWSAVMPPIVMATLNSWVHPNIINLFSRTIGTPPSASCSIVGRLLDAVHLPEVSAVWPRLLFGHRYHSDTAGGVHDRLLGTVHCTGLHFVQKIFDGAFDSLSEDLGTVLVNTTWRFSTIYVVNATFLGSANQLLQMSQILMRSLCIYFFKFDYGIINFDFGYWYAFHLSILALVMLFSPFIPYLPLLGTLYFAIRYCVDRHNIAYDVLQLPLDSTGEIAGSAVKSMLICISLTQFAMSGVFLNSQDVLPPVCITLLYIASVATWLLLYESNADAVVVATESLHKLELSPLTKMAMDTIKLCYMHPCDARDLIDGKKTPGQVQR